MWGWLFACGQVATPAGSLATWSIDAPAPRPSTFDLSGEVTDVVCEGPGGEPAGARVLVRWQGWSAGTDRHLAWVEAKIVAPGPRLEVASLAPGPAGGLSLEPGAPWVGVVDLTFRCTRAGWFGGRWTNHQGVDVVRVTASE